MIGPERSRSPIGRHADGDRPGHDRPAQGVVALLGSMIGIAVGLLAFLVYDAVNAPRPIPAPSPETGIENWSMQPLTREFSPAQPTWSSEMNVSVSGGELIVVMATSTPVPTPTPGVIPTAPPALPSCATAVPGETCEWPIPIPTPIPPAACETPAPGERCTWPTLTPAPASASLPMPPR